MTRRLVLAAVVLFALLWPPDTAFAQCAMCRRVLQSPEGQQMIAALRGGILFLLAAPFAVFGAIATLAVRAQRRRIDVPSHSSPYDVSFCEANHPSAAAGSTTGSGATG